MTMDYRNSSNVYPDYHYHTYQEAGHQYPQPHMQHHSQQQQQQHFSQHSMPGPVRNFNNNIISPQHHQQNRQFSHQQWAQPYSQTYPQHNQNQQYFSPPYVPNFLMTSGIGLTPTLTPTTLATIEQSFLELQSGHQNKSWDSVPQSGFVPPVVDPGHSNEVSQDSQDYSSDYSDTEWEPQPKKGRMSQVMKDIKNDLIVTSTGTYDAAPQRSYRRRNKDEKLPPEEEERRRIRRERNKIAAAKCRQRRVDQTNTLVEETERLEAEQSQLESEIQSLQQEKDQLEFILQAHQPLCKFDKSGLHLNKVKAEPESRPHSCESHSQHSLGASSVKPENMSTSVSSAASVVISRTGSSVPPTGSSQEALEVFALTSRPNSLPFNKRDHARTLSVTSATGVTINTPSSGLTITPSSLFCPGLDSMFDGSSGLTPLTGISCSSQVQRNSSDGGSETIGSPSLVSL